MSRYLWNPLSPEEQQCVMNQLYVLLGEQVRRYHRHRHMGENTSVPVEVAQELMESIQYTMELAGGVFGNTDVEEVFGAGQIILAERLRKAKSLMRLVTATSPQWQTECRWEAIRNLQYYLDYYDHLHMAHRGPDELFYPILISPPEGAMGVDRCIYYLKVLWIENQIMASVPDDVLNSFWDRLPVETMNQCEQLIINGIGKALLGAGINQLILEPEEQIRIFRVLMDATEKSLIEAGKLLCLWLDIKDENARVYVKAAASVLSHWTGVGITDMNIDSLFV